MPAWSSLPSMTSLLASRCRLLRLVSFKSDMCIVCHEEMSGWERVTRRLSTLPCLHSYHTQCIDPWLERSGNCPLCRQSV